ncbi:hypothetical protein NA57DRAFT_41515 [Rhizodiscina lignyota]|uniref:Inositol hexakisphosphate and diphosphoinositol-pentakisphosphate kinase n=1 Tax=Rhizodiscina lignyota TaxID=1504668 RepID=A0A9P4IC89_9PEZI|nr:hypothetical protein NA57DRAFT_41515 [Rhizodiscina lignyota]
MPGSLTCVLVKNGELAPTTATTPLSVTTASHINGVGNAPHTLTPRESTSPSSPSFLPSTSQPGSVPASYTSGPVTRSRSRTRAQRRISGSQAPGSASPGSERSERRTPSIGVIGVCALDNKARSKPSRNILNRLIAKNEFEVKIFGDKVILDEAVENWPICDFLISFFSDGFPLDKAIAYAKLRKPFCVNDLPMQMVLWDRRLCLKILDQLKVPTPYRVEVNRDGGPRLPSPDIAKAVYETTGVKLEGSEDGTGGGMKPPKKVRLLENGDVLEVDGRQIRKPFVEKPVSGEDHNIHVYNRGGGGRRLFRKINNKSSEQDDSLTTPRSITEPDRSYIYEQFLQVANAEDVKAYTVGPDFCHAETRKSPVVDGIVKRNPSGKEIRYITSLTKEEAEIASKISSGFGQRVCGFDLLRVGDKSYVIDVNGWSFVKDNNEYYDKCAKILRDMFAEEKERRTAQGRKAPQQEVEERAAVPQRKGGTASHHISTLKSLFKSPSMKNLASHHPHLHLRTHGSVSPDLSGSTVPITSPPSFERTSGTSTGIPLSPVISSQPDLRKLNDEAKLQPPPEVPASVSNEHIPPPAPAPASKAQWQLKGVVSVIRHADRTPKQKLKFTFHSRPFVDLLKGHTEEVLLIGEAALGSVLSAVREAIQAGEEDPDKLRSLQNALVKKGDWPGTKVQIKPMFRKRKKEELLEGMEEPPISPVQTDDSPSIDAKRQNSLIPEGEEPSPAQRRSDSTAGVTLSRISAAEKNLILDKLQLIIKWGGEPTHASRYQAQQLGQNWRSELLLLNREALDDVTVFSSSERRSTTTAQIFASTFLADEDLPHDFITVRKDLLDDSNAAKDEMDKVKKKLKPLLREGIKPPPQFAWPEGEPEPSVVVRKVVELMKFHREVMRRNFAKLRASSAVLSLTGIANNQNSPISPGASPPSPSQGIGPAVASAHVINPAAARVLNQAKEINDIQPRWCSGEDPELFRERWEKLFAEFCDTEKVDPSKISELYDSMKFDALHNRQFLEWVFTPDSGMLQEDALFEDDGSVKMPKQEEEMREYVSSKEKKASRPTTPGIAFEENRPPEKERPKDNDKGKDTIAHRMGLRKRSDPKEPQTLPMSAAPTSAPDSDQANSYSHQADSYFSLYTGATGMARAKQDARLVKLRELYARVKVLFDYIGPQEYGISNSEKLEIGLLTSLPLLKEIVKDLEEVQASEGAKSFFYFTKESHIYTLLNCIMEGGVETKLSRNKIPELDYLSQITFELYESRNPRRGDVPESFNYSIKITLSPGCHTFEILDVQLDSKHCIGIAPKRSLTNHIEWREILETLRAKFHTVKLPKSFVAINLSEKLPQEFNIGVEDDKDMVPVQLPPAAVPDENVLGD